MISVGVQQMREALQMVGFEGLTERQAEMHRASAYYHGKQYADLPEWEAGSGLEPREMQPRLQYRLITTITNQLVHYIIGQDRDPTFELEGGDETLTQEVKALASDRPRSMNILSKLWETTRLALLHSAVGVGFVKRTTSGGVRYSMKLMQADMLDPVFAEEDPESAATYDLQDDELVRLEQYWMKYHEDVVAGETWFTLHRRTWGVERTVEYVPLDLRQVSNPDQVTWTENAQTTVQHDLGFVPAEYIRPFPLEGSKDGIPLFSDPEFDCVDSINYTLSQLDRGIAYNQEPTQVFLGVQPEGAELEKGSGKSWALQSHSGGNVDAKLLELQGSGQTVAREYVKDVRDVLYDVAQVVRHDPQQAANVMSGVGMRRMLAPTVARTHSIRPKIGKPYARLLRKGAIADGIAAAADEAVRVYVSWPQVVEPTSQDKMTDQSRAITAKDAGIITQQTLVDNVAPHYGVDDTTRYYEEDLQAEAGGGTATPIEPDEGEPEDDEGEEAEE